MQTINRNNYEEYFLLYTDGELNAAQRLAVEDFVQQNPDLELELEMFLNTKFKAEAIEFDNKESLLRTEGHSINERNYEEYFLLYIDNELSAAKRAEVEIYVLHHPQLQDAFTTLKQVVLIPEAIQYNNKAGLHRKEKRRIIYLKPRRFAAAAIFIGVCAVGLWLWQKQNNATSVALNNAIRDGFGQTQVKPDSMTTIKPAVIDTANKQTQQPSSAAEQSLPVKEAQKNKNETAVLKQKQNTTTQKKGNKIADIKPAEVPDEPVVIAHNNIVKQQEAPAAATEDIIPESSIEKQNEVAAVQMPLKNEALLENYKIYTVAYKEIDTNDEERSLRIGMLDLNKDKVKGLLKKAGRMFGKSNNTNTNDDGKLQVANFEIDTQKQ